MSSKIEALRRNHTTRPPGHVRTCLLLFTWPITPIFESGNNTQSSVLLHHDTTHTWGLRPWGVILLHTATGSWALPSILSVSVGYLLLEYSLLTHPFLRVSQAFHDYLVKIVFIGTNLWLGYTVWHRKECSILRKPCGGSTVSMLVGGDLRTLWMTHHWVTD